MIARSTHVTLVSWCLLSHIIESLVVSSFVCVCVSMWYCWCVTSVIPSSPDYVRACHATMLGIPYLMRQHERRQNNFISLYHFTDFSRAVCAHLDNIQTERFVYRTLLACFFITKYDLTHLIPAFCRAALRLSIDV